MVETLIPAFGATASRTFIASATTSVPMPSPPAAVAAQAAALDAGVRVGCFRPPSVPDGVSRLRVTASAGVADDDWSRALDVLVGMMGTFR